HRHYPLQPRRRQRKEGLPQFAYPRPARCAGGLHENRLTVNRERSLAMLTKRPRRHDTANGAPDDRAFDDTVRGLRALSASLRTQADRVDAAIRILLDDGRRPAPPGRTAPHAARIMAFILRR